MQEYHRKSFFSIVRKIVPESSVSLNLRKLKWLLDKKRNSKHYEIKNNVATLILDGEIKQKILFPNYNVITSLTSHIDVPGYLQIPLIKEGSTVIDAGAYPGDFTVVASNLVGQAGRVYAFEPDPDARNYLEEMLKYNNISNVTIVPLALDNKSGTTLFLKQKMGLFDKRYNNQRYGQSIFEAKTTTLDDFCQNMKIDVIKMDIEGTEINVINGAKRIINEMHPAFIIASYHIYKGKPSSIKLEQMLKLHYNNVETLYKNHPTTYAYN